MPTHPAHPNKPFVIQRTLAAPRALVWAAFTEREHLMHWMSPAGMTMARCTLDLRPGGVFHYGLTGPDGKTMWGKWTFREIVAPERLVVVVEFSDEAGGVTRHPFAPDWPLATLSTTRFEDLGAQTRLSLEWTAYNANETEQKTFDGAHAGMEQGWGGTFKQLEAYLAAAQGKEPSA